MKTRPVGTSPGGSKKYRRRRRGMRADGGFNAATRWSMLTPERFKPLMKSLAPGNGAKLPCRSPGYSLGSTGSAEATTWSSRIRETTRANSPLASFVTAIRTR
jgi:hypothetical protein